MDALDDWGQGNEGTLEVVLESDEEVESLLEEMEQQNTLELLRQSDDDSITQDENLSYNTELPQHTTTTSYTSPHQQNSLLDLADDDYYYSSTKRDHFLHDLVNGGDAFASSPELLRGKSPALSNSLPVFPFVNGVNGLTLHTETEGSDEIDDDAGEIRIMEMNISERDLLAVKSIVALQAQIEAASPSFLPHFLSGYYGDASGFNTFNIPDAEFQEVNERNYSRRSDQKRRRAERNVGKRLKRSKEGAVECGRIRRRKLRLNTNGTAAVEEPINFCCHFCKIKIPLKEENIPSIIKHVNPPERHHQVLKVPEKLSTFKETVRLSVLVAKTKAKAQVRLLSRLECRYCSQQIPCSLESSEHMLIHSHWCNLTERASNRFFTCCFCGQLVSRNAIKHHFDPKAKRVCKKMHATMFQLMSCVCVYYMQENRPTCIVCNTERWSYKGHSADMEPVCELCQINITSGNTTELQARDVTGCALCNCNCSTKYVTYWASELESLFIGETCLEKLKHPQESVSEELIKEREEKLMELLNTALTKVTVESIQENTIQQSLYPPLNPDPYIHTNTNINNNNINNNSTIIIYSQNADLTNKASTVLPTTQTTTTTTTTTVHENTSNNILNNNSSNSNICSSSSSSSSSNICSSSSSSSNSLTQTSTHNTTSKSFIRIRTHSTKMIEKTKLYTISNSSDPSPFTRLRASNARQGYTDTVPPVRLILPGKSPRDTEDRENTSPAIARDSRDSVKFVKVDGEIAMPNPHLHVGILNNCDNFKKHTPAHQNNSNISAQFKPQSCVKISKLLNNPSGDSQRIQQSIISTTQQSPTTPTQTNNNSNNIQHISVCTNTHIEKKSKYIIRCSTTSTEAKFDMLKKPERLNKRSHVVIKTYSHLPVKPNPPTVIKLNKNT